MRTFAIATIALLLFTALPAQADKLGPNDECDSHVPTREKPTTKCIRFDSGDWMTDDQKDDYGAAWFLWLGTPEAKLTPSKNHLTGQQGLVPLLYTDSNGYDGLQRSTTYYGQPRAPDALLLI